MNSWIRLAALAFAIAVTAAIVAMCSMLMEQFLLVFAHMSKSQLSLVHVAPIFSLLPLLAVAIRRKRLEREAESLEHN